MSRQKVVIATPIHRQPHPRMDAARRAVRGTSRHKVACIEHRGESLISRARNTIVAAFFQTDADWLYFWDDDIETLNIGGEAGNLIDMLVSHDKPVVGGLYATRGIGGHCAGRVYEGRPASGRLWNVRYLAGGSLMVNRSALEGMIQAHPELQYQPLANEGATGTVAALFQPYIYEGEYLSEDYAFCQRWLDMGQGVWADLDVQLLHWGEAPFALADPRKGVGE